jgi:cell division protein FtsB
MKNKLIETLKLKEELLSDVWSLQIIATESQLEDLDKNEIELKAQISLLRHLLSEPENNNLTELIDRLEIAIKVKGSECTWDEKFRDLITNAWKNKEEQLLE